MFTESLIAQATAILEKYYGGTRKEPPFPLSELANRLVDLGAVDDADLRDLTWENLQSLGMPRMQAQKISALFRGNHVASADSQTLVIRSMADEVGELSHFDLLARFAQHPTALHGAVAEQLRARSGNKPFIVLEDDGKIDVHTSAKVLEGIAAGDDYGETFRVEGRPHYLRRVGEISNPIRDAHPVFADKALQLDGSDYLDIYWGDVSLECRQLIWIASNETHEFVASDNRERLLDLRDRALQGMRVLSERYQHAYRLFEERKQLGSLPALRTRLMTAKAG